MSPRVPEYIQRLHRPQTCVWLAETSHVEDSAVRCHLTSSFAAVISIMATKGRQLTTKINKGRNKLEVKRWGPKCKTSEVQKYQKQKLNKTQIDNEEMQEDTELNR